MTSRGDKAKQDGGKAMWDLLPYREVGQVVDVLTHGAVKYTADGWQKVKDAQNRYFAAMMRHLVAWEGGEITDPESGFPHLAHAGCCLFFMMWFDNEHATEYEAE